MSLQVKYLNTVAKIGEISDILGYGNQSGTPIENAVSGAPDVPWATLEPGVWKLDGTRKIIPNNVSTNLGVWSKDLSDSTGWSDSVLYVDITFTQKMPGSSGGFTFVFSQSTGQWCKYLTVTWYNGNTQIFNQNLSPKSAVFSVQAPESEFDTVLIAFRGTYQPYQFVKLQKILWGNYVVIENDEIIRAETQHDVDPLLCELPVSVSTVEVRNKNGHTILPQPNQNVQIYQNDHLVASHFMQSIERPEKNRYVVKLQSAVGLLESQYLGGIYGVRDGSTGYQEMTIRNLLNDILGDIPYVLDAEFSDIKMVGYLPICTRREALQQVAFAIGAAVITQGSDAIRITKLDSKKSDTPIANSKIFNGGSLEKMPVYSSVQVAEHTYLLSTVEENALENVEVNGNRVLFTLTKPYDTNSARIEGSGVVIRDRGANWLQLSGQGTVTVKAKPYIVTTVIHSRENPNASQEDKNNILLVDSATLIHKGNVEAALDRLYNAVNSTHKLSQDIVVQKEKVGRLIDSVNPWGTHTVGHIVSMTSQYTNTGHKASIEIVGSEVES